MTPDEQAAYDQGYADGHGEGYVHGITLATFAMLALAGVVAAIVWWVLR